MHELPITQSESDRLKRELDNLFDFRQFEEEDPAPTFEEISQRESDSYASYRYQPDEYDEDLNHLRSNPGAQIPVMSQEEARLRTRNTHGEDASLSPAPAAMSPSPLPAPQVAPPAAQQTQLALSALFPPSPGASKPADMYRGRPPQTVQPPLNIDISLVEISTFCPDWYIIPEVVSRAIRNNWTRDTLAKAELHAINDMTPAAWKAAVGRVQKQVSEGCQLYQGEKSERFSSHDFRTDFGKQNDLTANQWRFRFTYPQYGDQSKPKSIDFEGFPLSQLYAHVVNWPAGNDRLLMTQYLEFAQNNAQLNLDTSHWDWIIQSQGFTAPRAPLLENRDVDALRRLNANVPNLRT